MSLEAGAFIGIAKLIDGDVHCDNRGRLRMLQWDQHLPFVPRRVCVINEVPPGAERGKHAHRESHQVLLCLSGRIEVAVADPTPTWETFQLEPDGPALYVPVLRWLVLRNPLQKESASLLVLASDKYDPSECVNDFKRFTQLGRSV